MTAVRAWLGLGSNLDDPPAQLQHAVHALAALPQTRVVLRSPVYRNPALPVPGQPPQPDYFNAVVAVDTGLAPLALLDSLQGIENARGRVRGSVRWAARTLDIDLLLYGSETLRLTRLTVPHPELAGRRFVLQPLLDIAPALALPDGTAVADLLARCPPGELTLAGRLT